MESKPRHLNSEFDKELFKGLQKLVYKEVKKLPNSRLKLLKIKYFVWSTLYFCIYIVALFQSERVWLFYLLYSVMGLLVVVIFSELIHELCHKNIFKKPKTNLIAFKLFDLLGANSYIWGKRHLRLHHRYPNVNGWDADVEQKGPIAIFTDDSSNKIKKYQHRYIFLLYPLFILNWLFIRDFKDYFSKYRVIRKIIKIPRIEYFKLFFFKGFYIFLMVLAPWLFGGFTLIQSFVGLIILTISGSIMAMPVLLTPHINPYNEFPNVNSYGTINKSWFRHQIDSTNDINSSSWITRNILGNFNNHLCHHLFPRISSAYSVEVTQIMKTYLHKYGLPYKSYSLIECLKIHFQLIKNNAVLIGGKALKSY